MSFEAIFSLLLLPAVASALVGISIGTVDLWRPRAMWVRWLDLSALACLLSAVVVLLVGNT